MWRLAIGWLMAFVAAATAAPAPPPPPQRIVSLLPSLTESVCALGACARLVGTDRYSDFPPEVQALPKLGGLDDAQVERIVALRPDLVIAGASARIVERLESLGLRVVVLETKNHDDVHRMLTVLQDLLALPGSADRIWSAIEADLVVAAARVPARLRGLRVYFEIDATPYAAGPGLFVGETLARLGMGNVVPAALGVSPRLNPEFVVRSQPDIVMASARAVDEMNRRPGWSALHALRGGQRCGFATERFDLLIRPGPRLGEAALALADCLAALPVGPSGR